MDVCFSCQCVCVRFCLCIDVLPWYRLLGMFRAHRISGLFFGSQTEEAAHREPPKGKCKAGSRGSVQSLACRTGL